MAELGLGERKTTRTSIDRWLYSCTSSLKSHLIASVGLPKHINVWATHHSTQSAPLITAHYPATTLCRNPNSNHYFPPQPVKWLPAHTNSRDLSPHPQR